MRSLNPARILAIACVTVMALSFAGCGGQAQSTQYPPDASGKPDPSYDDYFVEGGLPDDHDFILVDIFGADDGELWFSHHLLNGARWTEIFTRDGNPPYGFNEGD